MKPSKILLVSTLCLMALVGCGEVGDSDPGSGTTSTPATVVPPTTPGLSQEAAPAVVDTATLAPRFAVFRGPRERADELKRRFPHQMVVALGLDLEASRLSRLVYGKPAYLIPAKGPICLFTANEAVGSCWKPGVIASGRAIATGLCGPGLDADHVVTFGLVPDGVREVTILRTNVPSVTVPVEGNLFVGKTSSKTPLPLNVTWIQGGKRVVRSSGIPPKVAREGCRQGARRPAKGSRPSG